MEYNRIRINEYNEMSRRYILNTLFIILKILSEEFFHSLLTTKNVEMNVMFIQSITTENKELGLLEIDGDKSFFVLTRKFLEILGTELGMRILSIEKGNLHPDDLKWVSKFVSVNTVFYSSKDDSSRILIEYVEEIVFKFIYFCNRYVLVGEKSEEKLRLKKNHRTNFRNFLSQQNKNWNFRYITNRIMYIYPKFPQNEKVECGNIFISQDENVNLIGEKLRKTYNSKVLDGKENELFFKSCKLIALWFEKLTSDNVYDIKKRYPGLNTSLLRLTSNYFLNNDVPVPKQLSGPRQMTILKHRGMNKNIFLFGESHAFIRPCSGDDKYSANNPTAMTEYLKDLFNNTGTFTDLFLEYNNQSKTFCDILRSRCNMYKTSIDAIGTEFEACARDDMKECLYNDTVRVHFFDTRFSLIPNRKLFNFFLIKFDNVKYILPKYKKYLYDLFSSKINNDLNEHVKKLSRHIMNEILDDKLLQKEFKNFDGGKELIRERLIEFTMQEIRNNAVLKFLPFLIQFSEKINKLPDYEKITPDIKKEIDLIIPDEDIKLFINFVIDCQVHQIDNYMIARLFKKYTGGINKCAPAEVYNSIVYAGYKHTQFQIKFLVSILNFRKVYDYRNPKKHDCVNFPDTQGKTLLNRYARIYN